MKSDVAAFLSYDILSSTLSFSGVTYLQKIVHQTKNFLSYGDFFPLFSRIDG